MSLARLERREIAGKSFTVKPLTMEVGRDGLARLLQILGVAAGTALPGMDTLSLKSLLDDAKKAVTDADAGGFFAAGGGFLRGLAEKMEPETLRYFVDLFKGSTTVEIIPGADGITLARQGAMDLVFDGDYFAQFEWLAFALEVNYLGFFVAAVARVGIKRKPAAPAQ